MWKLAEIWVMENVAKIQPASTLSRLDTWQVQEIFCVDFSKSSVSAVHYDGMQIKTIMKIENCIIRPNVRLQTYLGDQLYIL